MTARRVDRIVPVYFILISFGESYHASRFYPYIKLNIMLAVDKL